MIGSSCKVSRLNEACAFTQPFRKAKGVSSGSHSVPLAWGVECRTPPYLTPQHNKEGHRAILSVGT